MIALRSFLLTLAALALPLHAAPAPTIDPAPAAAAAAAAAPAATGFAEGASTTSLPFRLLNNHIYVQAIVDGRPLTLLFDSGGLDVLSKQTATALGLSVKAAGDDVGGDAGLARAKRLELGAYGRNDPEFYVADLGRLPEVEGLAIDGLVGFESLKATAVTIDYAARRITLTAPSAFVAPAGAVKLPFELLNTTQQPVIDGEVDGMKGRFTIDTGARGSVALSAPFVSARGLLERYPRRHEYTTGWGIGGATRAYATRGGWLKLGSVEVKAPVLELAVPSLGEPGERYIAGNIGGGILKRFTVTLDYAGSALYLQPNAELTAFDPFDRSGMWLNLDGDELIVDDLMANGPAARAQVQKHDRIVSVDGVAAAQVPLLDLRAKLRDLPKGYHVRMTLRRDSKLVYATIVLDDLVPPP